MSNASEPDKQARSVRRTRRKTKADVQVVGIGASAGGVRTLEQFFERMPADSGLAFVVILHLSPEHASNLAELLQRRTTMPVIQVSKSAQVEPNYVYVIPPAKHLMMSDGMVKLAAPNAEKGKRVPIDFFFRTLADVYQTNAIGIILSGTGADGTLGLRRIKEHGGIAIAQDPQEAEYDGMPRSAINAGLVDLILPVAEMPERLIALQQGAARSKLLPGSDKPPNEAEAEALREVFTLLRIRTGHDFSHYKRSTVLRRIARRLQLHELESIAAYRSYLREHPNEAQGLFSELLISVTNFFRDPQAFEMLEHLIIPKILANKADGEQVRVWVPACATGEEAYSLAILLQEQLLQLGREPNFQIFATDVYEESINTAREGLFPETIVGDVSAERLQHFFVKEGQQYRIRKEIREKLLFAVHNVLRDPPFSRLDLLSCRNLFIYLNRETQEHVLEIFHFALRPNGYLFLGSSESADSLPELFTAVDKKARLFQCRAVGQAGRAIPAMPLVSKGEPRPPQLLAPGSKAISYGELHWMLLEEHAPPSVLVNENREIVHVSETAARYLRFTAGEPSHDLLKAVQAELRLELRAALYTAAQENQTSETRPVRLKLEGKTRMVRLTVHPVKRLAAAHGFLLVVFDEIEAAANPVAREETAETQTTGQVDQVEPLVRRMEEELQRNKAQLRTTIEQYETAAEELKASNEELQAINEELRSASEELETSKEELQSVNEELTTVNHELKEKVDEVSRTNSDLQNLLGSTDIGTIFLDRELRIKRFTPRVEEIFNIIPSDLERPFAHLTHKLDYQLLPADAEHVLQTLERIEYEVYSADQRWYLVRLSPYRTVDDRIDGVVVAFVEISERKEAEERVRESQERLRIAVEAASLGTWDWDLDTGRATIDEQLCRLLEIMPVSSSLSLAEGLSFIHPDDREQMREQCERATADGNAIEIEYRVLLPEGGTRWITSYGRVVTKAAGNTKRMIGVSLDNTLRREAEEILRLSRDESVTLAKARTHELEATNLTLQAEIIERRAAEAQVKELLHRVIGLQESERQRIARELHDQLGQQLTALLLNLKAAQEQQDCPPPIAATLEQLKASLTALDRDVDRLTFELHPPILNDHGLAEALRQYAKEWSAVSRVPVDFHAIGLDHERLPVEVETTIYRIVQEALTNTLKHAQATQVSLILEHKHNELFIIIEDNGVGFEVETVGQGTERQSLGLRGMRERLTLLNGRFNLESNPGAGTTVYARIPIPSNKGGDK